MRPALARRIAQAATAARYEDFSPLVAPGVVARLKLCLLDLFACAFEARDLPWSQRAATIAGRVPSLARKRRVLTACNVILSEGE